MPTARVVDLSHHNVIPDSLHDLRAAGVWGVIHKATEGTSFKDSKLDARYHLTKDAGLLWGAYHFLRPGDMAKQAQFFVETMLPYTDDKTLFACDFEVSGIMLHEVDNFMDAVELRTGRSCVLYSGHSLKDAIIAGQAPVDLNERRLWLAQYSASPTLPKGWSSYWLWQYSDQGIVSGVTPPTDVNAFQGTIDDLEKTWSGRAIEPQPEPVPVKPLVGITVRGDVEVAVNGKVVYP